jgi:hypothetical protein
MDDEVLIHSAGHRKHVNVCSIFFSHILGLTGLSHQGIPSEIAQFIDLEVVEGEGNSNELRHIQAQNMRSATHFFFMYFKAYCIYVPALKSHGS